MAAGGALDIDISDVTVIKAGNTFCVAGRDGGLPEGEHALGAFLDDCRHLRTHVLRFDGRAPWALDASDGAGDLAIHELADPRDARAGDGTPDRRSLRIRIERRVRADGLDETIALHSRAQVPVELGVELLLDADFVPMLELRGLVPPLDRPVRSEAEDGTLRLSGRGADGWTRSTTVTCPEARAGADGRLRARVRIEPGAVQELAIACRFAATPPDGGMAAAAAAADAAPRGRVAVPPAAPTQLACGDPVVDDIVRRSLLDLRLLRSELDGRPYVAAGIPWYATLFGRDSLITALQVLALDPDLAAGTLHLLAARQGTRDDPRRDEEPGKMLHELRLGEVLHADRTPLARYYGTVDATALFLMLLCRHADWTGSTRLFDELRPGVDAALAWLDRHGDADGDGLIEYVRRADGGLDNQGWKDSPEGICDEDGAQLRAPVALVEAQGYAIRARLDVARLLDRSGEGAAAARLRAAAERTRAALGAFWLPERRAYAMALDGDKRPSRALASNQGHLLWAEAVDAAAARAIRDGVMGADLHSGWGVRTLGRGEAAFDPLGYHTGSVWPHDTALIAAGLREYGFDADFAGLLDGLLDAAAAFPGRRLPELFGGGDRVRGEPPAPYPVACRPQAWAAGAVPYLLIVALGLVPDGLAGALRIRRPLLPRGVDAAELRGLRIAGASVDLRFERERPGEPVATVADVRVEGDLDVVVEG